MRSGMLPRGSGVGGGGGGGKGVGEIDLPFLL